MVTIEKVERVLSEIRQYSDLQNFIETKGEEFCIRHRIKGGELNFLTCVVSSERMRAGNIALKKEILNRRN